MDENKPTILTRDQHCISRKQIDSDTLKVLYRLHRHGYKAYLVGGSVRDLLLGRQPKDFDIGTDATPNQVHKLFRNSFLVGRRFRLVHINFAGNKQIEVATFRRHPREDELPDDPDKYFHFVQNVFGSPAEDANRRDFTINALFYNIADFSVIDYLGGLNDLKNQRLRVIGDPQIRFVEDPVRMLRAIEFSKRLNFSLDENIYSAISTHKELLATAAPARIREEIMELFRHKISGVVLEECRHLEMLPHLLAGYPGTNESLALLKKIDKRTAAGVPIEEGFAIAALYLKLFMDSCPPDTPINLTQALHKANQIIDSHCTYFSISGGIRHHSRELLLGCFRLARGRGYRAEKRFLHHPFTPKALELFTLWAQVHSDLVPLAESWNRAIKELSPAKNQPRRRRNKSKNSRKRRRPSASPQT